MADIIVFEVHAGNVARALNFMWNLGLLQNMAKPSANTAAVPQTTVQKTVVNPMKKS